MFNGVPPSGYHAIKIPSLSPHLRRIAWPPAHIEGEKEVVYIGAMLDAIDAPQLGGMEL
jgi:hypothetical protein